MCHIEFCYIWTAVLQHYFLQAGLDVTLLSVLAAVKPCY